MMSEIISVIKKVKPGFCLRDDRGHEYMFALVIETGEAVA